jgi:hypothetical protein
LPEVSVVHVRWLPLPSRHENVGCFVGAADGAAVGDMVGCFVVGNAVGNAVGETEGGRVGHAAVARSSMIAPRLAYSAEM